MPDPIVPSLRKRRFDAPVLAAPVLAALVLASSGFARAQGTDEQREACTPDAVKLCSDTIPDIPKTTACMKAHLAQLTPRCRAAFNGATAPASGADQAPAAQNAPDAGAEPPAALPGSVAAYRQSIQRDCDEGLIDAYTCRNTLQVLGGLD